MYKCLVALIVLSFVLSPVTFGDIGQAENFNINANDALSLLGRPGISVSGNTMAVGQSQAAATPGLDLNIIFQSEMGIINQGAIAISLSSVLDAMQEAGLTGHQTQNGNKGGVGQEQNWTGNLGQQVNKNNGIGGIIAGQGLAIGQVQITANRNGISSDANISGAVQIDGIASKPGLDVILQEFMTISAK